MDYQLCMKCKGRGFCNNTCPFNKIYSRDFSRVKDFASQTPPSIFVGRFNYPDINVGVLSPVNYEGNVDELANHYKWFQQRYSINQIAGLRGELINSRVKTNVKKAEKLLPVFQELAMAKKSTNIEVHLKKEITPNVQIFKIDMPMGPNAELEKIKLGENVKVDRNIEKYYYQPDVKSTEAIQKLYSKGVNETRLSQILSGGMLGVKTQRKLVPTRWSITAVDDLLGKNLIKEIKNKDTINDYRVLFSSQLGNQFCILLFPGAWSYELFEYFENARNGATHDKEGYFGRKEYAKETAGGYYAARLGVLEYLNNIKKQAQVVIFRKITKEYYLSLGVWQVRENVRKAENHERKFETLEKAVEYVKAIMSADVEILTQKSELIKGEKHQKKLTAFL